MIAALLLLAVELPLGPFARPGVPVLLDSATPVEVDLAGWKWRVEGPTEVAPPQLPCTIALPEGSLEVRAPADGRILVGSLRAGGSDAVPIRLVRGMGWQPLDLFDRIVVGECEPWERAILEAWARAGGDVAFPDQEAAPARPLPVPRAGDVLPEIYDLATARGVGSRSFSVARRIAAGLAAVLLLLLLAGARGRLGARPVVTFSLVVGLTGGTVGAWLTQREAEPFSSARVVIHYPGRTRTFTMVRAEWDGAAMPAPAGVPFFYRGAGDPWWADGDRVLRAGEGIVRGFVRDAEATEPVREGSTERRRILDRIFRSQLPKGAEPRWWWGPEAFHGGAESPTALLEIEAGAVR